jgi:O-antigen/teichoic acid export membrane protein
MKFKNYRTRFLINFFWLFSLNNLGYLFSIITLPILISKFGYQDMGVVFTVQAIIFGMVAIANYSLVFYIPTQSKAISVNENAFKETWSLSINIRAYISVLLTLASLLFVFIYFKDYFNLWLLSLPIVIFKIANPILFFNALEKNKYVLLIGFLSKLLFLLFVIVISNKDYINFCLGLSELLIVLFFLKQSKQPFFEFQLLSLKKITLFLKITFNLFLVNFFSLLKPASILPLTSYLFGPSYATIYTLADKIINMVRGVSGAMFTSFFPIYNKERFDLTVFRKKTGVLVLCCLLLFVALIYIGSPYLIFVLNNFQENNIAVNILRILSLSIPMFFIIIPLFSYLLELKKWNIILNFAILQLAVLFLFYMIFHNNLYQIAIGFVISEYILLAGYIFYIAKLKKA